MTIETIGATGFPAFAGPPGAVAAPGEDLPEAMPYLTEVPKSKAGPTLASVKELQRRLKAAGFDPGPTDGWLGPRTAKALRAYQQAHGLKVDAEAGPKTWAALGLKGAPRPGAPKPAAPSIGPNQPSNLGLPPVAAPVPAAPPSEEAPADGSPHDRRHDWFLSQQRGKFNPNEDVLGNGNCGPASATMVARAFGKIQFDAGGVDAAVEETRRRMGDGMNEKKGTSFAGIVRGLESYGLQAQVKSSPNTIDLIEGELAQGKLVIAHVKATYIWGPNAKNGHYTVVTKVENGNVFLNDPSGINGPLVVSIPEFKKAIAARGTYSIISARP